MSDDQLDPKSTSEPKDAPAQQRRAPSPEAAAARRARRIGGRPVAGAGTARAASEAAEGSVDAAPVEAGEASRPTLRKKQKRAAAEAETAKAETAKVTTARAETAKTKTAKSQTAKAETAEAADATRTGAGTSPSWLTWVPALALSAAALVMAVLLVIFSHGVWWGPDPGRGPDSKTVDALRQRVLAASKSCLAQTNTYDYTKLDDYEKGALSCATGQFANQLKQTIETLVKVNAPKLKAKQTAQINKGGIETVSADGSQWTVLLFGQLSVVNTSDPKGRTDPFAAQVQMEKVHGIWLISQLKTVSSPLG